MLLHKNDFNSLKQELITDKLIIDKHIPVQE